MYIEELLPQLLKHVDVRAWQRPAALLELIARNTWNGGAFVLYPGMLAELGRSPAQADYDRRVLAQLADNAVLHRWPGKGRQPDAWKLNPRFGGWKHVPWLTPQRQLWRDLSARLSVDSARLCAKRPGERVLLFGVGNPLEEVLDEVTRTFAVHELRTTARHLRTTARSERGEALGTTDNRAAGDDPLSMLTSERTTPSLNPSQPEPAKGGREGRIALTGPGWRLVEAFRDAWADKLPMGLHPNLEQRLGVVADRCPTEHFDSLLARCDSFRAAGVASFTYALALLERWTPDDLDAAPVVDVQPRINVILRLLASAEADGWEPDDVDALRAELRDLQTQQEGIHR